MTDRRNRCDACGGVRPARDTGEYTRERLRLIAEVGFCACRTTVTADGRPAVEPRAAEPQAAEPAGRREVPVAAETVPMNRIHVRAGSASG
ncbi:hypothetical protein ACFFMN_18915 [Planobispora siamensis]|uniref:Uncharacterized protein n=1 Tax=Planobispora siamensis TaxID=936338 RepID=A0A8J3SKZ0_9ACTN|nr:hypothetical protein [Planobispora siamensis]GIH94506.1 hypothetical protein Psi01_51360 [Planobispora siamensis]